MKDIDKFRGAEQLPSGYTKLDYIESNGTQHIDTGYYWTKENIKIGQLDYYTLILKRKLSWNIRYITAMTL